MWLSCCFQSRRCYGVEPAWGPCWSLMFYQHSQRVTLNSSFIYFFPHVENAIIISWWDFHRLIMLYPEIIWGLWLIDSFTPSFINSYTGAFVLVSVHLSSTLSTRFCDKMVTFLNNSLFITHWKWAFWLMWLEWCPMLSHISWVWLFAILWTEAHQASLSMGFSRQGAGGSGCMSSSKGPSKPRDHTCISYVSCIGRWVIYH